MPHKSEEVLKTFCPVGATESERILENTIEISNSYNGFIHRNGPNLASDGSLPDSLKTFERELELLLLECRFLSIQRKPTASQRTVPLGS